jgi:hypothetical protein
LAAGLGRFHVAVLPYSSAMIFVMYSVQSQP